MELKCKKTRNGEYAKFVFSDNDDYENFIILLSRVREEGDYPRLSEFIGYVKEICNPSDGYEEGRMSVTLWQDRIGTVAGAFTDLLYAFHEKVIHMMQEKIDLLREMKVEIGPEDTGNGNQEV